MQASTDDSAAAREFVDGGVGLLRTARRYEGSSSERR